MVAGSFVVNEWVHLNQDAQIADVPQIITPNVDYQITLSSVDITNVFNLYFQQNGANEDLYDITSNSDMTSLTTLLSANNAWSAISVNGAVDIGLAAVAGDTAPHRILETVALRVFGHAAARAAITNDLEFPVSVGNLASPFTNALMNKRNELFNQYVALGRITNANDVNVPHQMDLSNFNLSFLLEVDGRLLDPSNVPITNVYENGFAGYNTGSGQTYSTMSNGQYMIPVLVTFSA